MRTLNWTLVASVVVCSLSGASCTTHNGVIAAAVPPDARYMEEASVPPEYWDVVACSIQGEAKLDPGDNTNGAKHYKGTVKLSALQKFDIAEVLLFSPDYLCYCANCPRNYGHMTPPALQVTIPAGSSLDLTVDCASFAPVSGPVGRGIVEHFVVTSPPNAGLFNKVSCEGSFDFVN